ncbi:hypothetical protein Tther_00985 [Tepidimonas thermarum]|uniref:Chaperone modulatory protein CbpM n=1 Tax=Tepidimonas thermarum TaxID=335431 RepID=A0A554X3V3_9BURK|nr:MerR family transcriptional regulator [Tepidimonas thermarum]TSE30436.1 hypothetical protein Tther_00985 [Tepidimonas thermarum]
MERDVLRVDISLDAPGLDAEALCRAAGVALTWWHEALQAGRVSACADAQGFDAAALRRVRRLAWLQHHFDADPELAALVVDLEEEIERLRAQVRRLSFDAGV